MLIKINALLMFLFMFGALLAQDAQPKDVEVGLYVTDISNVNWKEGTFSVSFWMWFISDSSELNPEKTLQISNARDVTYRLAKPQQVGENRWWTAAKVSAQVEQLANARYFPFVSQRLQCIVEDRNYDTNYLAYVIDDQHSKIDPNIDLSGWKVADFKLETTEKTYDTSLGNPEREQSTFSQAIITVTLEKKSLKMFFRLFGTMYFSYFLSFCVFFIPLKELNIKLGLLCFAILLAISSKLIIDSYLPQVGDLTLVDQLELTTFLFFGIAVFIVLLASIFNQKKRFTIARKIEHIGGVTSFLLYFAFNYYWVEDALRFSGI